MTTIGFVGLGNMGGPMAANLVHGGHEVLGFDTSESAREAAVDAGVQIVGTVRELVVEAGVILTMLPTGAHVHEVVLGSDGVAAHAAPGTLIVDSSTIDIPTTNVLHDELAGRSLAFVDAPVSGGVAKATSGALTFMVGGTPEHFALAEPYLGLMGANIVHAGVGRAGQAAKICNNMLFGATITAVSESFSLGEKLGLEPDKLFDIVATSSGDSWAMHNFCPVPGLVPGSSSDEGYVARFAAALMSKDLNLALAAAAHVDIDLPVSGRANEVFAEFAASEGHLDASGVIRQIRGRD